MMMTLGLFVFALPTASYQQLVRATAWRHTEQARLGERPAYQYAGPGDDTLSLSGTLYPELTGGRLSLDLIRTMADTGKGWPLIEGTGRLYGHWAITRVNETDSEQLRDGAPQKIDFTLDLVRVDDRRFDLLATGINAALSGATGLLAGPLNSLRDRLGL